MLPKNLQKELVLLNQSDSNNLSFQMGLHAKLGLKELPYQSLFSAKMRLQKGLQVSKTWLLNRLGKQTSILGEICFQTSSQLVVILALKVSLKDCKDKFPKLHHNKSESKSSLQQRKGLRLGWVDRFSVLLALSSKCG